MKQPFVGEKRKTVHFELYKYSFSDSFNLLTHKKRAMDGGLKRGGDPLHKMKLGWMAEDGLGDVEERELELRLGPPGYSGTKPPSPQHASNNGGEASSTTQTRIASTPVVGWPPIRSYRRNLATSSKPSLESEKDGSEAAPKAENGKKGLFVKINMDGIPIGRKLDLRAYDSYEKLPSAVDQLFCGLIAAQRGSHTSGSRSNVELAGLLDGTGEYTLVYEDDEGDRMLVGDVPWQMFVSTVKRLRVLKSSELSALSLGAVNRKRTLTDLT